LFVNQVLRGLLAIILQAMFYVFSDFMYKLLLLSNSLY